MIGDRGEVIWNFPRHNALVMKISENDYEEIVNLLRSNGFYVRDKYKAYPFLDPSIPAIGGPYSSSDPPIELNGTGRNIAILDTGINVRELVELGCLKSERASAKGHVRTFTGAEQ